MNTTSQAPPEGPAQGPDTGPRVTRDEIRDLGRLRRTTEDRKLAGVAGGLARHLDIDPIIPRVTLVVLALFGGVGVLLYGVCWLIVPTEGSEEATVRLDARSRTVALGVVGALGAFALLGDAFGGWGFPWPLVLVAAIVLLVAAFLPGRDAPPPAAPPVPPASPPTAPPYDGGMHTPPTPAAPPPARTRRGPVLFWYTLAVIAIGVGVLGMVDLAGAPVASSAYPALALATCGVALVVGAFWGRAGGVILLGLASAVATAGGIAADRLDAGHLEARPASAAAVESSYELGAGEIELDLTDVGDLASLDGRSVTLDVDLGRIYVVVPAGLEVDVDADVDVGDRSVLDTDRRTTTIDGGPDAPTLTLEASVGLGQIEIVREGTDR